MKQPEEKQDFTNSSGHHQLEQALDETGNSEITT
jgi:hypothetical protein